MHFFLSSLLWNLTDYMGTFLQTQRICVFKFLHKAVISSSFLLILKYWANPKLSFFNLYNYMSSAMSQMYEKQLSGKQMIDIILPCSDITSNHHRIKNLQE